MTHAKQFQALCQDSSLESMEIFRAIPEGLRVESQVNFSFLKTLQARKIPCILIVNQIDKHVSLELSLAELLGTSSRGIGSFDFTMSKGCN